MAVKTRKSFGATITVGTKSYHTFNDWKMTIINNNYIGDPEVETNYLDVPGRDTMLDYSEALTGRPVYKSRPIKIELQGLREKMSWDIEVSRLRNILHGRIAKVYFDNDESHYWEGRIYLREMDREKTLGSFVLEMPTAQPFKYDKFSSTVDYDWDTFDFEEDVDRYIGVLDFTEGYTVEIPISEIPGVPVVLVINVTTLRSDTLTMRSSSNNKTYSLKRGRNRYPELHVAGASVVTLTFTGSAKLTIDYRAARL